MLRAPPVPDHASTWLRSVDARYPYSLTHAPAKTPVCVCRSESAGIPACSSASYATSSSSRCWGSILAASRGEISKNSASKASISLKNEPHRVVPASAAATSGEPSSNAASDRAEPRRPLTGRHTGTATTLPGQLISAGKAATQADDRDRLVRSTRRSPRTTASASDSAFGRSEKRRERVDRRMLPELHRRNRPAEQLGQFTRKHHRVARSHPQIVASTASRSIVFGTAADLRHQVVHQPVPKSGLVGTPPSYR